LRPLVDRIRPKPMLHVIEEADHGFHLPKRTGRSDDDVLSELCSTLAAWSGQIAAGSDASVRRSRWRSAP
jgi:hypothetical protein